MRVFSALCLSGVLAASLVGCGGGSPPGEVSPIGEVKSVDELKQRLQYVADSGQAGSALAGLDAEINKIADEAKKKALLADFAKLSATQDPNAAKALAKAMIAKL
jgi:hypothetical protein